MYEYTMNETTSLEDVAKLDKEETLCASVKPTSMKLE